MKKLLLVSAVAASTLMAQGYKIPEQSLNSTALAGAYVSNATTADAAYYNPANMAFMSNDKHLELNAMYIHLNPVDFSGDIIDPTTGTPTYSVSQSKSEDFILPQGYLVSKPFGEGENVRIGLSINEPAGLSKRWPDGIEAAYAEEFTLKVIEVNPTISYKIIDNLAIAGGVRFVYSEGVIKSALGLDMEGSSWDIGYNLALSYKPFEAWGMAVTYRSNVDLTETGGQTVTDPAYLAMGITSVPASVTVPLPATLTLATDVDITESTNVELVFERVFWSTYENLDIQVMGQSVNPSGEPTPKNWEDTSTIRLGLTQGLGDSLNLMVGLSYDPSPVPDSSLGFELPDSDAYIASIGTRWAVNDELDLGAAILYDAKDDRFVSASDSDTHLDGTFSNASALLVSVGLGYKF